MTASAWGDGQRIFVVRADGDWWLAPLPATDPVQIDLNEVVRLTRSSAEVPGQLRSGPASAARVPLEVGPQDVVRPHWLVIGEVVGGNWVVEDRAGGQVALDEVDLAILDRTGTDGRTVDAIADQAELPLEDVVERIGAWASTLGVDVTPASPPTNPAAEVAAPVEVPGDAPEPVPPRPVPAPPVPPSLPSRVVRRAATLARRSETARRAVHLLRRAQGALGPAVPEPEPVPSEPVQVEPEPVPSEPVHVVSEPVDVVPDPEPVVSEPAHTRIPVYAVWHESVGPLLALGMLTATARHWDGGALNERYEIRVPETAGSVLDDVASRGPGPAVLLCSDYVWSLEANLEVARRVRELNPLVTIIHGGPSVPKYEIDEQEFFARHGDLADVVVRGEGELALVELLGVLAPGLPVVDPAPLADVAGISYRGAEGAVVRTPDRERLADLDLLPSPYLTGEFDHIPADAWNVCLSIETNRGCPYGCTFCDWGSATKSRIRKFDLERVAAEFQWVADHGISAIQLTDANFGIMSRDVEITERLVEAKRRTGFPLFVSWTPAKNTKKHITRIMDLFIEAEIGVSASLSLQTTDEATLSAINRDNISIDHYLALAAEYRRRQHPLQGDLLLGLPEQTYESYRNDLQFMLDHEIVPRTWPVQVLPNAPMNEPGYKAQHRIVADERHLVVSTATFSPADRVHMLGIRKVDVIAERLGVLRHVMRYLQWDHGIPATEVMERVLTVTEEVPTRYPLLAWTFSYFDIFTSAPTSWTSLYQEVGRFVVDEFGIDPDDGALACVLELQHHLMPSPARAFPSTITLSHDYLAYYRSATRSLYTTGHAGAPERPLATYGPSTFTVDSDPLRLCTDGLRFGGVSRDEAMQGDFYVLIGNANELLSPLVNASLPAVVREVTPERLATMLPDTSALPPVEVAERRARPDGSNPVVLRRRSSTAADASGASGELDDEPASAST